MAVAKRGTAKVPTGNPTTGGTVTVDASVVAGDLLVVELTSRDHTAGTALPTVSGGGAGAWTLVGNSTDRKALTFRKIAGGDSAGATITVAGCVGSCSFVHQAYSGADGTTPIQDFLVTTLASGTESLATFTPTSPDSMLCLGVHNYANDNAITGPTSVNHGAMAFTEKLSTGGSDCATMLADDLLTGATATGTISWTQATNGVAYGIRFTIKPAPLTITVTPDPVPLNLGVPAAVVAVGVEVSPSPVSLNLAIPVPTVTADAAPTVVSPSPVVLNLGVPSAVVEVGRTLTPDPVTVTLAAPGATVEVGHLLSPSPVQVSLAVPVAAVEVGRIVAPDPVSISLEVPSASVTAGVLVAPSPVPLLLEVPEASVETVGGAILLTPAPVELVLAVPVAGVEVGREISPDPVEVSLAVPVSAVEVGVLVSPQPVPLALAVPQVAVAVGIEVAPEPVGLILALPAVIVSLGEVEVFLTPDPVVLTLGIGAIVVSNVEWTGIVSTRSLSFGSSRDATLPASSSDVGGIVSSRDVTAEWSTRSEDG